MVRIYALHPQNTPGLALHLLKRTRTLNHDYATAGPTLLTTGLDMGALKQNEFPRALQDSKSDTGP